MTAWIQGLGDIAWIWWIIGYAMGSLNMALIGAHLGWWSDPRQAGSGNAGMTNVWRVHGMRQAVVVLLGDTLKAFIPLLWLHDHTMLSPLAWSGVWLAMVLGHCFPIGFGFQGGKGIATAFGGLCAYSMPIAGVALAVFALVLLIFRYVSLASLVAAHVALGILAYAQPILLGPLAALSSCLLFQHRQNIQRLWSGTEKKVGHKPLPTDPPPP